MKTYNVDSQVVLQLLDDNLGSQAAVASDDASIEDECVDAMLFDLWNVGDLLESSLSEA